MGATLQKTITKIIGREKHTFIVQADTFHKVVMEAQNLSFPDVKECGLCKSDDLALGAHLAQDKHEYTHVTCRKCRGYINFGKQQSNPNIYFLRLKKDDKGNTLKTNGKTEYDWLPFAPREN